MGMGKWGLRAGGEGDEVSVWDVWMAGMVGKAKGSCRSPLEQPMEGGRRGGNGTTGLSW